MANTTSGLNLESIWSMVKSLTSSSQNGSLGATDIISVLKNIIGSFSSNSSPSTNGGSLIDTAKSLPWGEIASKLFGLYNQYKGSNDDNEQQSALNVKNISSVASTIGSLLNNNKGNDNASPLGGLISSFISEDDDKDDNSLKDSIIGSLFADKDDNDSPLSSLIDKVIKDDDDDDSLLGKIGSLFGNDNEDKENNTSETISKGLDMLGGLFGK